MPTNAILLSSSILSSYSNLECITFKGLFGECSANPISSKNIIDIFSLFPSFFNFSSDLEAFSKISTTSSEVLHNEP